MSTDAEAMTDLSPAVLVGADTDRDDWFEHMAGWGGWWVAFRFVMMIFMVLMNDWAAMRGLPYIIRRDAASCDGRENAVVSDSERALGIGGAPFVGRPG
jgi:hypothetical protein